jgi:aspartate 1-decarboxylase
LQIKGENINNSFYKCSASFILFTFAPLFMQIEVLKSKIHRVKLTQTELHYVGSITIDEALLEAANMIENEKVQVVNVNNGERLETYIIKGERNSGVICLNGPAARKGFVGDHLIIISYALMDFEEAKKHTPIAIYPDNNNKLIS